MLKLYHIPSEGDPFGGSRNGCKALIVLEEVGEPYELVRLSRMSDCRPPDAPFRKINPNGVTPAIDDDGLIVWESAATSRNDPTDCQPVAEGRERPGYGLAMACVGGRDLYACLAGDVLRCHQAATGLHRG